MTKEILEELDFFRVRNSIASYCLTPEGKEELLHRTPFSIEKISSAEYHKNLSKEYTDFLRAGRPAPFTSFEKVKPFFAAIKISGNLLELDELFELGRFVKSVNLAKKNLSSQSENEYQRKEQFKLKLENLVKISEELDDLSESEKIIFSVIDQNGALRELPSIRELKNTIAKIQKDIEKLMKNYFSDSSMRDILQSSVPVLRGERQVLAVKVQYKNRISGIVHEMSQTGQTVFIEPEELVMRNNDLIQTEYALEVEIRRILKETCAKLKEHVPAFENAHRLMMTLDMAHASASYAIENNCAFIRTSNLDGKTDTKFLDIRQARHPLLGKDAVPVDLTLPDKCRMLVITGPNTGGKTVTLKTVALLSLMNQAGFPLPVNEYSLLPSFDKVFADIGDTQSIDQSLSTFSGHMKKIAQACRYASEKSLVLLDELASGTDPLEGGALAMAVLDRLLEKKAFVLVTTHHGILKNYAYTRENCINASVEINSQTLKPTYRIIMGLPGESHALDIASHSGLEKVIIENARKYMENENTDVSVLIKTLSEKYEELNQLEIEARKKEKIITEKWRKVDLKDLKLRQKEKELREQGYKKSRNFIDENRRMLENLVRELREGEITREKTLKVKETIAELEAKVLEEKKALIAEEENIIEREKLLAADENQNEKTEAEKIKWEPGMEVYAGSSRSSGILIDRAKKGYWNVQFGSLKMAVKESDMILAPQSKKPEALVTVEMLKDTDNLVLGLPDERVHFRGKLSDKPVFELRLLGLRVEDALKALERQIDLCELNSFKSFSVIHGKGTGALQEAVHKMLSQNPCVSEFHFARPEEGGSGKTYVQLN